MDAYNTSVAAVVVVNSSELTNLKISTQFVPSNSSRPEPLDTYTRDLIFIIAMIVSSFISIIGNGFTFKIIVTEKSMRTATNYLVANMAFSDVIGGITNIIQFPLCTSQHYQYWKMGTALCSVNQSILYTTFFVSAFTMTTIASDRFRGIVARPLGYQNKSGHRIAIIWIAAFILNTPGYSSISIPEYFSEHKLLTFRVLQQYSWSKILMQIRMVISFITQFILPLIVTSFAYYKILHVIKNRELIGQHLANRRMQFHQQKLKLMRMLIAVVLVFTLSWLPIHASTLFLVFAGNAFVKVEEVPTFFLFLYWFALNSCCINPFVYFWYYKEFRTQLKNSWKRISQSTSNLMDISIISRSSVNSETNGIPSDTIM